MIELHDPLHGEMFQILDEKGQVKSGLDPKILDTDLKKIYALMVTARVADTKAFKLQRQGRLGTYAPSRGQEACQVGAAFAIQKDDWVFPYFRDLGMYITLAYPLQDYYLYWMGNEEGMHSPPGLNIFPLAIPVASQLPHSVGAGIAANLRKAEIAVICTFGDGATSEGDFHEAMNFAGVFQTPNVFICYNNLYAISTPQKKQTASGTLAQKAMAYGFHGVVVDGNDVLAVYVTAREALEKARSGKGPTLIEALTYRLSDHTTSDDATKYRSEEEVKEWEKKDPIERFRIYLKNKGLWDESWEKSIQEQAAVLAEKAVEVAESVPSPQPEEIFVHTYKNLPPNLKEQLEELKAFIKEEEK
jgi:pyruvate dehydrogenase E1 component alpha subunit